MIAITEQDGNEELGVFGALKMSVAVEGEDGDCIRALLLTGRGHAKESIPQGLKPLLSYASGSAKAKALAYLEAHTPKFPRAHSPPIRLS